MKLTLKRGSAAAAADAGDDTPRTVAPRVRGGAAVAPDPAPAGTLHRAYVGGYAPASDGGDVATTSTGERQHRRWLQHSAGIVRRTWLVGTWGRIAVGALLFFLLGAAAAMLYVTRSWLLHDQRFVIASSESIAFSGNQRLTREQLLSVFGEDLERNIWKVSLPERRADLERLPWVEHATVMRLLPNRIRVAITERAPVAFVRNGTNIGLVDAGGVLLDMPPDSAGDLHYSFPVLTGLAPEDPLATRAARMDIYRRFLAEIDGGGAKRSDSVSEVDVSNPEDVKAMIAGNGSDVLVHFGDGQFLTRFEHFEQHLAEWRQAYPKLAAVDMRYERQVVLEMQQAPAAASADAAQPPAQSSAPASAQAIPVAVAHDSKPVAMTKPAAKPGAAPHAPAAPHAAGTSAANEKTFAALRAQRAADTQVPR